MRRLLDHHLLPVYYMGEEGDPHHRSHQEQEEAEEILRLIILHLSFLDLLRLGARVRLHLQVVLLLVSLLEGVEVVVGPPITIHHHRSYLLINSTHPHRTFRLLRQLPAES